jgi:hypothetical protein
MMKMMEPMSQGKLSPEDQKKMADTMKSCPMMKTMPQQQKPTPQTVSEKPGGYW